MLRQLSITWMSYQRPWHTHTLLPLILQPRQSSLSGVHFLKERMSLSDPESVFSYISFCFQALSTYISYHIKGCPCLNTLSSQVEGIFSHAHICFSCYSMLFMSAAQNIEGRKHLECFFLFFWVLCNCANYTQSNKPGMLCSLPFWKIPIKGVKPV